MKCSIHLRCLILGLGLMVAGGCSMSRGSIASRKSDSDRRAAEELSEEAPVKTASRESAADADLDADAPPSQPGVKSSRGSRTKLAGWLQKGDTKSGSIPLDRTDKSKQDAEESLAEEDTGIWKHDDGTGTAPLTAGKTAAGKAKDSSDLSLDSANPFDQ